VNFYIFIRVFKVRFLGTGVGTFGKLINTGRFDSPLKSHSQITEVITNFSNKKKESIGIGFIHNYSCFLSGGICSYSQPYGEPAL